MSTDSSRTFVGSGSSEQVFGGDRSRSFRMSSFAYSWKDVFVLRMRRNGYFWTSGVRHGRWIRRPRFPIRMQNFGDLATFSVDFCILYAECPPYFYFRFVWPTDLKSITRVDPYVDNSHQVWSWYDHTLPSYGVFVCQYVRDLVTLTFWPWTVIIHGGSRDQPCHQVWRPKLSYSKILCWKSQIFVTMATGVCLSQIWLA